MLPLLPLTSPSSEPDEDVSAPGTASSTGVAIVAAGAGSAAPRTSDDADDASSDLFVRGTVARMESEGVEEGQEGEGEDTSASDGIVAPVGDVDEEREAAFQSLQALRELHASAPPPLVSSALGGFQAPPSIPVAVESLQLLRVHLLAQTLEGGGPAVGGAIARAAQHATVVNLGSATCTHHGHHPCACMVAARILESHAVAAAEAAELRSAPIGGPPLRPWARLWLATDPEAYLIQPRFAVRLRGVNRPRGTGASAAGEDSEVEAEAGAGSGSRARGGGSAARGRGRGGYAQPLGATQQPPASVLDGFVVPRLPSTSNTRARALYKPSPAAVAVSVADGAAHAPLVPQFIAAAPRPSFPARTAGAPSSSAVVSAFAAASLLLCGRTVMRCLEGRQRLRLTSTAPRTKAFSGHRCVHTCHPADDSSHRHRRCRRRRRRRFSRRCDRCVSA